MPPSHDRSFHVLELSVQPGGSRWAELHAYTDPKHLRAWLEVFCDNSGGISAYHAIWYGALLGIWTVQQGDVVGFLNVYPHITVRLGDHPPVPLYDDDALRPLIVAERRRRFTELEGELEGEDAEDLEDELEADYHDIDSDIYEDMELLLDWPAIAEKLPALTPPLLRPGERANVRHPDQPRGSHLGTGTIRFGSYDRELAKTLRPPFPLPAAAFEPEYESDDEDESQDEDEDDDDESEDESESESESDDEA